MTTLLCVLAGDTRPRLDVRAYPVLGVAPMYVTLFAEMKNPSEDWLCPTVAWIAPDESESTQFSDRDAAAEPETFWSKRYRIGSPCECVFSVELRRGTKTLTRQSVTVEAQ